MTSEVPQALSGRLSFLLGRLYMRALDLEARRLEALGVTVKQQAVLALLADEGPMTQQHLGQRLGIDRTTVVTVVDGLEQARLVERRRSPADRRAYLLTLTPDGVRAGSRGAAW
ncbi:MarR family transcriptional regulator [Microbispora bryophytorum subsp. camponoti]